MLHRTPAPVADRGPVQGVCSQAVGPDHPMTGMPPVVEGPEMPLSAPTGDADLLRLLRELPDAVVVVGPTGILVWGNSTAERLFGTTIAEALGLSGLDFVHPEDLPFVLLSLETIQEKEVGRPDRDPPEDPVRAGA